MGKLTNKKQLPNFECKQQSKTLDGKHLSSHKNPNLTQINHKNRSLSHTEHFSNHSREQMY
ncbi:TetR family transcriptional regulator [Vibrio cholerae]|uniref:TetR family transcriptional regulator n=1 Tax=Vibrio cholerae TaxID=666 RepID=UPI0027B966E1|nr:TetR family transcriptional regulator [Vibrio cholerae]